MRGILFAVGVVACTKAPEEPEFAAPRQVNAFLEDGRHVILFGDSRIAFAPPSQVEMPEALGVVDGANLLGENLECNHERLAGVTLFPLAMASAAIDTAPGVTSESIPEINGTAVAKLRINYSAGYSCDGTRNLAGSSIFTFYPGDRFYREDVEIQPTETPLDVVCDPCGQNNSYSFTSFWTFRRPPVEGSSRFELCVADQGATLGLAWRDKQAEGPRINGNATTYDWAHLDMAIPAQPRTAASVVALSARPDDCAAAIAATRDPALFVNGNPVEAGDDGAYELGVGTGTFTLTAGEPMSHGFPILLQARSVSHVRVTRSDGVNIPRIVEFHNDKTLVWIDDGFGEDQSITLEVD